MAVVDGGYGLIGDPARKASGSNIGIGGEHTMKADLKQRVSACLSDHKRRRQLASIISVLSIVTVFAVYAALLRPAVSMTSTSPEAQEVNTVSVSKTTAASTSGSVGTSLSTAQGSVPSGSETYRTILGSSGVYYGIIANTWNQTEAETNAAIKVLNASLQTGNDLTNYADQPWVIGRISTGSFILKGFPADVWCRAEDASKITAGTGNAINYNFCTEDALDAYVNGLIVNASAVSADMAGKSSFLTSNTTYVTASGGRVAIDITSLGAGTYYVNLDSAYANQQADGLSVKKNTNQTIVFNYTGTSITLQKYTCVNGGTSYSSDTTKGTSIGTVASSVVWNMPNATTVNIAGSTTGVLLAPKATVTINGTSSGWLVANTVISGSGEWHNVWQEMDENYDKPAGNGFVASKTVDGEVPTSNQIFTFYLSEKNSSGAWSTIQTKQNSGSQVAFDDIAYNAVGTHYYRISEAGGNIGYANNATAYYIKTVVTAMTASNTTYYVASSTYYSDEACTKPLDSTAVAFDNISTTSVSIAKVWDDSGDHDHVRPAAVTVRLYADGADTGKTAALSDANNWKTMFGNLAAKSNGTSIAYTIVEDAVPGYATTIAGDASTGFTITNSHTVTTTGVSVDKVWKNTKVKTPVVIQLYRSTTNNYAGIAGSRPAGSSGSIPATVELPSDAELVDTRTLDDSNSWKYSWSELDDDYSYYVVEETPEDYVASYAYTIDASTNTMVATTVTNTKPYDLPKAGGIGVDSWYLFGSGLVVLAMVGLWRIGKRKGRPGGGSRCS